MIKIYRYNQLRNTVKIDICSNGGLRGTLVFDQGNVFTKEFPTVQVRTAFWQQVIEDSKLFKDDSVLNPNILPDKLKEVEDVTTVEQAIDYLASEYGVVAKTKLKAINEAHKHGIDFPNLK